MNKQGTVYTIIFIFIVSFAFVFLLSMTNQVTVEQVELNQELARRQAILSAMGIEAATEQQIQSEFDRIVGDPQRGLYVTTIDGSRVYASRFSGAGLWGTISGFLAVSADFNQIVGIEIVDDNETPGLGGRINEQWFKSQFEGEDISGGRLEVVMIEGDGDSDKSNGLVDGVTGATRTSDSIQIIVNDELERLQSAAVREELESLQTGGGNV
jgi:Na+-transporting NADH:ubiquinone oxidoreductase subunit C